MTATSHPRWVSLLRTALDTSMKENRDSISYAISTLDEGVTSPSAFPAPRVRFVVHRGFVNERRAGEDLSWSVNDSVDEKGDPLFGAAMMITTDVRAPKALQVTSNNEGGLIELAWWLVPTQEQFRVRARAFILPEPSHPLHKSFPADRLAPAGGKPFDWESERVRIFRKMAPALRASFVRPTPGTPLHREGKEDIDPSKFPLELPTDLEAKTDEDKRDIKEALKNLSLMVLEPFEVDWCELGATPHRRVLWNKDANGEWKERAVVP